MRSGGVASKFVEGDFSDTLRSLLKAEEEKLRSLRGQLAALQPTKSAAREAQQPLQVDRFIETLRSVEEMMEENPFAARQGIQQVIESIVLDPNGPDGEYRAEVTPKEETAALASGRPVVPEFAGKMSCGGRI